MSVLITSARAIVGVVGGIALLLAIGNLVTGGGSLTDPVFPLGLAFGAVMVGAAAWTTAPERWRAAVVWLAVIAVIAAFAGFLSNIGQAAPRDVIVYLGIPSAIVFAATAIVAIARVRSGALGRPSAG